MSLEPVSFPTSVRSIGENAFRGCSSFANVGGPCQPDMTNDAIRSLVEELRSARSGSRCDSSALLPSYMDEV